jgi:hypothetical protein
MFHRHSVAVQWFLQGEVPAAELPADLLERVETPNRNRSLLRTAERQQLPVVPQQRRWTAIPREQTVAHTARNRRAEGRKMG